MHSIKSQCLDCILNNSNNTSRPLAIGQNTNPPSYGEEQRAEVEQVLRYLGVGPENSLRFIDPQTKIIQVANIDSRPLPGPIRRSELRLVIRFLQALDSYIHSCWAGSDPDLPPRKAVLLYMRLLDFVLMAKVNQHYRRELALAFFRLPPEDEVVTRAKEEVIGRLPRICKAVGREELGDDLKCTFCKEFFPLPLAENTVEKPEAKESLLDREERIIREARARGRAKKAEIGSDGKLAKGDQDIPSELTHHAVSPAGQTSPEEPSSIPHAHPSSLSSEKAEESCTPVRLPCTHIVGQECLNNWVFSWWPLVRDQHGFWKPRKLRICSFCDTDFGIVDKTPVDIDSIPRKGRARRILKMRADLRNVVVAREEEGEEQKASTWWMDWLVRALEVDLQDGENGQIDYLVATF